MTRGGKREGAGRKKLYKSPTKAVRLPINEISSVKYFLANRSPLKLPLYHSNVPITSLSPADAEVKEYLELHDLIAHPAATFLVRVSDSLLKHAGIDKNAVLVVDRSLPLADDKMVIALIEGRLTIKRLQYESNKFYLLSENTEFSRIEIKKNDNNPIWGIVTKIIRDI